MQDSRPSQTAALVAACRAGLGAELPPGTRLCDDPYGMLFSTLPRTGVGAVLRQPVVWAALRTRPVLRMVLWMQVRTRYLDDALLAFVRGGGRQVVILGAGFDCRALRFARELEPATVFEVDHPATQASKLKVLADAHVPPARVQYVRMNFETESVRDLPAKLAAAGHDPRQPTFTIWEGVTMYLTEAAIEGTVAAIRDYTCAGSELAFTYFDRNRLMRKSLATRISSVYVRRYGEPWRFGWVPDALGGWLPARGFALRENANETSLAQRYLPADHARLFHDSGRYIALAVRKDGAVT